MHFRILRHLHRKVPALAAALTTFVAASFGQDVLQRWDFREGKARWFAAHSCAPLEAKDGRIVVRVSGPDPYVHSSRGSDFAIDGNPSQYIRMRARCNVAMPAEFFWAETTEGSDAGFVAGKEIHFRMHGDGREHTYNIFPGWTGRIARLRFDPPGGEDDGAVVEIASLEILQMPRPKDAGGPVWDFSGQLAGFIPGSYVEDFRLEPDAVTLTGYGAAATLVNQDLELDTAGFPWLTLDAEASRPTVLSVVWRDAEKGYTAARARVRMPEGKSRHTLRLADLRTWTGTITGLRIQWDASDDPLDVRFRRLALGTRPVGPPVHDILAIGLDRAVAFAGEPLAVQATVRNAGGSRLAESRLTVSTAGTVVTRIPVPPLAPGETQTLSGDVRLTTVGENLLQVSIGDGGPVYPIRAYVSHALPADGTEAGVVQNTRQMILAVQAARLRAPAAGDGVTYGPVFVEVRKGMGWRRVAVIPAAGGLQLRPGEHMEFMTGRGSLRRGQRPSLLFTNATRDSSGVRWTSSTEYRQGDRPGLIEMTHTLTTDGEGDVYRFDGPVIRAGDGTFGGEKHEALFPGLEYLAAHEASSSDRDILPPGDVRAVPHPNRVCIPLMALTSPAHSLVALLWDNTQRWDKSHDQPAAVFASPNLVESGDPRLASDQMQVTRTANNHLLGLFAPSIPHFMRENDLRARQPVRLGAGHSITLRSVLMVRPDGEVLDAITEWLRLYRPPSIGDPPESIPRHFAFAVRAFEEILYTEGKGWAGVKGWEPSPNPGTALIYMMLAERLQRPQLRDLAVKRIGGAPALPLALHLGNVAGAIQAVRSGGLRALERRERDGNWIFRPTEKTRTLGDAGDTNVGMAAGSVRHILKAAALAADQRLLKEGLTGLDWMRKWRVPRGSQVWEIPLHAPDILASAHCAAAFLWGYRLTGDESYLADAVYWARTGLPFVYFWQSPDEGLEPMRGGTIPIFGATFYVGSWYGRLVQWCGLEYAKVLLDLAPYDDSHDWRTVARDTTVSGWRQQQEKDGYQGLYPDSWSMLTGDISWGLMLGPLRLVHNQMSLDGWQPDGDVRLLRRGDAMAAVLTPGTIDSFTVLGTSGDGRRVIGLPGEIVELDFSHEFRLHQASYIAVVGVGAPTRVEVRGREVAQTQDLASCEAGWDWRPEIPGLVLKLASAPQRPQRVRISGLGIIPPQQSRTKWTFDDGPQGWTPDHDLQPLSVKDDALLCRATGSDPFLTTPVADIAADRYPRVRIRYRAPADGPLQVFWATTEGGYAPERSANASVQRADQWRSVEIDLSGTPTWRATILGLRIDPPVTGMDIDEVELLEKAGGID